MAIYGNTKNLYQPFIQALGGGTLPLEAGTASTSGVRIKDRLVCMISISSTFALTDARVTRFSLQARRRPTTCMVLLLMFA